jgi:hypothetical protein
MAVSDLPQQVSLMIRDKELNYVLLQLPLPIIKWAYIPRFQPARDAMEMESMLYLFSQRE